MTYWYIVDTGKLKAKILGKCPDTTKSNVFFYLFIHTLVVYFFFSKYIFLNPQCFSRNWNLTHYQVSCGRAVMLYDGSYWYYSSVQHGLPYEKLKNIYQITKDNHNSEIHNLWISFSSLQISKWFTHWKWHVSLIKGSVSLHRRADISGTGSGNCSNGTIQCYMKLWHKGRNSTASAHGREGRMWLSKPEFGHDTGVKPWLLKSAMGSLVTTTYQGPWFYISSEKCHLQ